MFKNLKGKKGEGKGGENGAIVCHTQLVHTYYWLEREGRGIVSVLRIFLRESSPDTIFSNNVNFTPAHMYLLHTQNHTHTGVYIQRHMYHHRD